MPPVIAIDAMGGDRAPGEIVAGALAAVDACDVDVLLVGQPDAIAPHLPDGRSPARVEILAASEVVEMHEDPANAIRSRKDSSLVRCADAVKDGKADAMVGAGNTGATMAAALLKWGRIKGVHRPAIAIPMPVIGDKNNRIQLLVDAGATVDPDAEWLVEWAVLAQEYARVRLGIDAPTIGLLSNGEEAGKGDALRKRASELFTDVKGFVGNVEGRDLMAPSADVIVTDGFTGNVVLKTLEGSLMGLAGMVFGVVDEPNTPWAEAADALKLRLLEAAAPLIPDNTGGGMLLGIKGVCVISHGSSSAAAIVNAVRVARECVEADVVGRLTSAIGGQ
ncbi:MAG TPA: phosphate acyltransferase PlsX [Acidimicrobiia bacterium]|jgi:glycerol-3-phosphate acyltransferase PlsX|nr:phosphate acyltransferase PlsX [Acidimicrobiia bacterium]